MWQHGSQGLWSLSTLFRLSVRLWRSHWLQCWHRCLFPRRSPDTKVCSDHNVPQDMLTGKIWLSISQQNSECTCHSLLDKLWLAPVHQASELWKPLMDEIWTSIFLSSCLLNKLLSKFTAMFADMCFRECSCCPGFPFVKRHKLYSEWKKMISVESKVSYNDNMRIFVKSIWIDGRFVLSSTRSMKAAESQVDCLMICLIVNQ